MQLSTPAPPNVALDGAKPRVTRNGRTLGRWCRARLFLRFRPRSYVSESRAIWKTVLAENRRSPRVALLPADQIPLDTRLAIARASPIDRLRRQATRVADAIASRPRTRHVRRAIARLCADTKLPPAPSRSTAHLPIRRRSDRQAGRSGHQHPHQFRLAVGAGLAENLLQVLAHRLVRDVELLRHLLQPVTAGQ